MRQRESASCLPAGFLLLVSILAVAGPVLAQAPDEELRATLETRFQLETLTLDLTHSATGLEGSFSLRGDLSAGLDPIAGERPEALAIRTLARLPEVLEASTKGELRLMGLETSARSAFVAYQLHVNGIPLEGFWIRVTTEEARVTGVHGEIVALSDEAVAATRAPTIGAANARSQVLALLRERASVEEPELARLVVATKLIGSAPYLVYDVTGGMWEYRLAANTGEVLRVTPAWQTAF